MLLIWLVNTDFKKNIKGESHTARRVSNPVAQVGKEDKIYVGDNDSDLYIGAIETVGELNTLGWSKKVGAVIKEKEQKKEEIQLNTIVVDVLSKHKYKFSSNSFKVLSVFLDLMIEEITLHAMNELVKNKKSIINTIYNKCKLAS